MSRIKNKVEFEYLTNLIRYSIEKENTTTSSIVNNYNSYYALFFEMNNRKDQFDHAIF